MARGETVPASAVAARLVDRLRTQPERPRLSDRETAVLRLVAEGYGDAEIGRSPYIGESTVKTYLLRVFGELGVDDRTAAVTRAMRYGRWSSEEGAGRSRRPSAALSRAGPPARPRSR